MEILQEYVVVVIMAICLAIGFIIKDCTPISNKYIPLILGIGGVILNAWMNEWAFSPEILLGGLASGLAATGAFEMVRNIAEK